MVCHDLWRRKVISYALPQQTASCDKHHTESGTGATRCRSRCCQLTGRGNRADWPEDIRHAPSPWWDSTTRDNMVQAFEVRQPRCLRQAYLDSLRIQPRCGLAWHSANASSSLPTLACKHAGYGLDSRLRGNDGIRWGLLSKQWHPHKPHTRANKGNYREISPRSSPKTQTIRPNSSARPM